MCNCVNETVAKFKEMYPDAERVSYQNIELMSGKVYSTIELKLKDKKKPIEKMLLHSYCPTCGKKYEEGE